MTNPKKRIRVNECRVYCVRANRYTVPYGILLRAKPHTQVLVKSNIFDNKQILLSIPDIIHDKDIPYDI